MYLISNPLKYTKCLKPTHRFADFKGNDEHDCYSENYIKCFWDICDYHKSIESFVTKPKEQGKLDRYLPCL